MAKTDSRTEIRPGLIKTRLHHLVVIKKKKGMTVKRLTERSRDYGGFTLLEKIRVTRRRRRGGRLFLSKTGWFFPLLSWEANIWQFFIRLGIIKNLENLWTFHEGSKNLPLCEKQPIEGENNTKAKTLEPELQLKLAYKNSTSRIFFFFFYLACSSKPSVLWRQAISFRENERSSESPCRTKRDWAPVFNRAHAESNET